MENSKLKIKNALSFDIEEYFQVLNFHRAVKRNEWDRYESRLAVGLSKILDILDENQVKATFFVLGWIAQRHANLIKNIAKRHHEIALHGYDHKLVYTQNKEEFNKEIRESLKILENISRNRIFGFRAPSFSITKKSLWALEILAKNGIKYDTSIFPIIHPDYGIEGAERFPHLINDNGYEIWEFPCSTMRIFGKNIPFSGGGYLRLLPYRIIRTCIARINNKDKPVVVYMHPWEFDPQQPKINAGRLNNFRHYNNLASTEHKLRQLLNDFNFTTIKDVLKL
jgi:polysaccharide deacetylase family protein (PEP-CTERM system associated)